MISEHERFAAFRRDLERQIPYSTDPQRLRDLAGVHQYSRAFTLGMLAIALSPIVLFVFGCWSAR